VTRPANMILLDELVSAALALVIGGLLGGLLAIQIFGFKLLAVQSGSMEPTFERGDLIVVRPSNIDEVELGEIVVFEEGRDVEFLAAHRVVGLVNLSLTIRDSRTGEVAAQHSRLLRTKGDANATEDPGLVDRGRFRGVSWLTVPGAGVLFGWLPARTILLGTAACSALAWAVVEIHARRN